MILRPVSKGHPPDSHATLVLKRLWFSSACGLISVQVEFNGSLDA